MLDQFISTIGDGKKCSYDAFFWFYFGLFQILVLMGDAEENFRILIQLLLEIFNVCTSGNTFMKYSISPAEVSYGKFQKAGKRVHLWVQNPRRENYLWCNKII